MSIVALGLNNPLFLTLGYGSYPSFGNEIDLSVENTVFGTNQYVPLTGTFATEVQMDGFLWDRRLLPDLTRPGTLYDTFIGGHSVGLLDGTWLGSWQSGSNSSLNYIDITNYRFGEFFTWTPRVGTGAYSFYFDTRRMYSDFSVSAPFNKNQNQNGVMIYELSDDALWHTVDVALYRRNETGRIFKYAVFDYVDTFSGEIDTGVDSRLATEDINGNVIWANLAGRKKEFRIIDNVAYLNQDCSVNVGQFATSGSFPIVNTIVAEALYESGGAGRLTGRSVFLEFFPIQEGTVDVVTVDSFGVFQQWTETTNLNFSEPSSYHYQVDYDLGIITMGGAQAEDLVLSEDITAGATVIPFYPGMDTQDWPEQGVLIVGAEEVAYFEKGVNAFYSCIRGYNSTTAAAYSVGAILENRRRGRGTEDNIYSAYIAVPRIEYEVTTYDRRSASKYDWLDIRPSTNIQTNNILQVVSAELSLDRLILSTDSPLIGGNLYGPIYYGTDTSFLTAQALDSFSNAFEDLEVTISITDGLGLLNGDALSYTNITNTIGEIYAFFGSSYNEAAIQKPVLSVAYDGADTLVTVSNFDSTAFPVDIWLFQVLKHDKVLGTVGDSFDITAAAVASPPYGSTYFEIDGVVDEEDFDGGYCYVIGTDTVKYYREITFVDTLLDGSDQPYSRIYVEPAITPALINGQPVWLFPEGAVEFNSAAMNGVRNIVYEWSTVAEHPITHVAGAYMPLHPDAVSGNVLRYSNRLLPIPAPTDDTNNLAGYIVVAPSIATLQASAADPFTGTTVTSNEIRIKLQLPNSLIGVDTSGALPIPYGWKLLTEEFNLGAGIGGANFITINPAATGINKFGILGII